MKRFFPFIAALVLPVVLFAGTPNGLALSNVATVARATPAGGGVVTSYANNGGSGDQRSYITLSSSIAYVYTGAGLPNLIDNNTSGTTDFYWLAQAVAGLYLRFDFGSPRLVDEAIYYQQNSVTQGVWQWRGSNDASTWTDIGGTFTLGGSSTQTITTLNGNTTAWRYLELYGVSGNLSNSPYVYKAFALQIGP